MFRRGPDDDLAESRRLDLRRRIVLRTAELGGAGCRALGAGCRLLEHVRPVLHVRRRDRHDQRGERRRGLRRATTRSASRRAPTRPVRGPSPTRRSSPRGRAGPAATSCGPTTPTCWATPSPTRASSTTAATTAGSTAPRLQLTADGATADTAAATMVAIDNKYEGANVVEKDGYYYLFVSATNCCNGALTGYSVFVGRSTRSARPVRRPRGQSRSRPSAPAAPRSSR